MAPCARLPCSSVAGLLVLATAATAQTPARFARPELLVDTAWLAANLNAPNVRIVDLRPRGYAEGHVPGAVWLDNNDIRIANRPPTLPADAAGVRRADGPARHLEPDAGHRLRRARRHLRRAAVVDPQPLRPRQRRPARRRLGEVGRRPAADRRRGADAWPRRPSRPRPGPSASPPPTTSRRRSTTRPSS